MENAELEELLAEAKVSSGILCSTLQAVHDAMGKEDGNPAIYRDAIHGAANAAHDLKLKVEQALRSLMREDGRNQTHATNLKIPD